MSSALAFLSHSGGDAEAALALARRLEESPLGRQHGLRVWVDKKDLVPGRGWKDQLQDALARSTAFAVYVGSKRVVNWVWDEVSVALDRVHQNADYPVIPIIAAQARFDELPSFLSQRHGVFDVEGNGEQFAALLRGLLHLDEGALIEAEQDPFQGLEAFTSERAHLFFGRDSDTDELLDRVRTESLVIVVGDSGSGKSSLVKAGLVPRFRGGGLANPSDRHNDETLWRVLQSRPLSDPFERLAEAILADAQAYGKPAKECSDLADLVRSRKVSTIKDAIQMSGPKGSTAKTLLIVDQFEELFTLADTATQTTFADALVQLAATSNGAIRIVLTMRWDYYHLCANSPLLYTRLEANNRRPRYTLRRMCADRLRQCITEPLRLAGAREAELETLAADVLKDVGERPNDLALLEMALQQAWVKRAEHGHDLLRTYVAIGRVDGALTNAAEEIITTKLTADEQALIEPLFIRLVTLGDTGGATRRNASRDELDGGRWQLAQKLATKECYRLVVAAGDTVEIAHEAIVTSWPRYVSWLRNDRAKNDLRADDKRLLDALVDDAQRWTAASEAQRLMFSAHGFDLERYEELSTRRQSWLCQREFYFIETSIRERERVRQRELKVARRLKQLAYGVAFSGFLAIALALVAGSYAVASARQSDAAIISAVIRTAAATVDVDPTVSALVLSTLRADREPDNVVPVAARVAHEFLATILHGHTGPVNSAAFSSDHRYIVTAGMDSTVRVWRTDGTGDAVVLSGHTGVVSTAQFSPNNTQIVTGGNDGTARVWRADGTGQPIVFRGHTEPVATAAFSPDNTRIVTSSADGTARVWRTDGIGEALVFRGGKGGLFGAVNSAVFSPDNMHIVTAGDDGIARVWRSDGAGDPVILRGHTRPILSAVFSLDNTQVLTAGGDGTVRVWRADGTGDPVVLRGHAGTVFTADFSPDNTYIVTAGDDATARVWLPDGTGNPTVFRGHTGTVYSAAFSHDNKYIVTAGRDGTARIWRPDGTDAVVLRGHTGTIFKVAVSSDDTRIVTASTDGTARVWDVNGTGDPVILRGHTGSVKTAEFSPNNTYILTIDDGAARVWRADGTGEPTILRGHTGTVNSADFSRNNKYIVTAGDDTTARVWRADGTGKPVVLRGHSGSVITAAISDDGTYIVTGSLDTTARVWRADGTHDPVVLHGHTKAVRSAIVSSDNTHIVTAGDDHTARVWRADGTRASVVLSGHGASVTTAIFSSDNRHILTASTDRTARIWRADGTGEPVVLRGHTGIVHSAVFSSDDAYVVTASGDSTARVWRADGTGEAVVLRGHTLTVLRAVFSPDNAHIVTSSLDGTARVWRADGTGEVLVLRGHTGTVNSAAFSPDGAYVVTAGRRDGTARVWRVTWATLLEVLRAGTKSCLTVEERRRYLGESEGDAQRVWGVCEVANGRKVNR